MKISENIERLQILLEEFGDIDICKKSVGAKFKMKPVKAEYILHRDCEIVRRFQGESSRASFESKESKCLELKVLDDIRNICEFERTDYDKHDFGRGE